MDNVLKFLSGFTLTLIVIIGSMLVGLLSVYIILDVSKLFELTFIVGLGLEKIYGLYIVIGIIRAKYSNEKDENDLSFTEKMGISIGKLISLVSILLIGWGLVYFAHWLFFN